MKKNVWEEEFRDELIEFAKCEGGFHLKRHWDEEGYYDLYEYLRKYIKEGQVNIKCRRGCIQIEEVSHEKD